MNQRRRTKVSRRYNITLRDLEQRHNVAKLERDGFTRQDIISAMYKHTDGASQEQRTEIINRIYDRSEK